MAIVIMDDTVLSSIANIIRNKTGTSDKLQLDDIITQLSGVELGPDPDTVALLKKFYERTYTSFIVPEGITKLRSYFMHVNSKVTSVTIPASVTSINDYAFYQCSNLKTVNILGNPSITSKAFNNCKNVTFNVSWASDADNPSDNTSWYKVSGYTINYNS